MNNDFYAYDTDTVLMLNICNIHMAVLCRHMTNVQRCFSGSVGIDWANSAETWRLKFDKSGHYIFALDITTNIANI